MKTLELKKGIYYCGVQDPELEVFDIVMRTNYGTTYNSYLIKGGEKTVLVDTAKETFFDEYLESIESLTSVQDIDYIVMNHNEPDHSGCIERLVKMNPEITVIASFAGIGFLKEIINCEFKSQVVKNQETLDIGGKTLEFMMFPNLHWPDTMFTLVKEDKLLFTCDCFGAHYCPKGILRSSITTVEMIDYLGEVKHYFDAIISPFKKPFLENALCKVQKMDIDIICPSHGPVIDTHLEQINDIYSGWCFGCNSQEKLECEIEPKNKMVVIPYVSAYGYTKKLAYAIAEGVKEAGDIEVELYDMVETDEAIVVEKMNQADGILFGTPTLLGDALKPIWDLTSHLLPAIHKGKHAAAFGSYGWSGEGVPNITERLKQLKLKVTDGYRVRFNPSDDQLKEAKAFGKSFAQKL